VVSLSNRPIYTMNCVDCRRSCYSWCYWTKRIFTLSTRENERTAIDRSRYRPRSGLTQFILFIFYLYLSFDIVEPGRPPRQSTPVEEFMITPTRRDNTYTTVAAYDWCSNSSIRDVATVELCSAEGRTCKSKLFNNCSSIS